MYAAAAAAPLPAHGRRWPSLTVDATAARRRRLREELGELPEATQRIEDADVGPPRIRVLGDIIELYCGQ